MSLKEIVSAFIDAILTVTIVLVLGLIIGAGFWTPIILADRLQSYWYLLLMLLTLPGAIAIDTVIMLIIDRMDY